ncbi:MAG: TFIIB-type zinc ribbon-containing protein [Nitrososphaeria archaeon]
MEEPLQLAIRCPSCGARALLLDPATGEIVCQRCGAVVRERVADESGGERLAGDVEERAGREHRGPPTTLTRHDLGLSTMISDKDRDASGAALSPEVRAMMRRLRLWDGRHESRERDLMRALDLIAALAGRLGLPEAAAERAALIYRRAQGAGLLVGHAIPPFAAASVLAATRELGIPRRIADVAAAAGLGKHEVYRAYSLLWEAGMVEAAAVQSPEAFVARVASAAGLPEAVARRALELLRGLRASWPGAAAGRDPMGLAAAAVYVAAKLVCADSRLTQRDLAEVTGVTEVTIRKGVRALGYRCDQGRCVPVGARKT